MYRLRYLRSHSDRNLRLTEVQRALEELCELHDRNLLGFDREGFYYMSYTSNMVAQNNILRKEIEAAGVELERLATVRLNESIAPIALPSPTQTEITASDVWETFEGIQFRYEWPLRANTGTYQQRLPTINRNTLFEVGDRVQCRLEDLVSTGVIDTIGEGVIRIIKDRDGRTGYWSTDPTKVTIISKALKVRDKVYIKHRDIRYQGESIPSNSIGEVTNVNNPSNQELQRFNLNHINPLLFGIQKLEVNFPEFSRFSCFSDELILIQDETNQLALPEQIEKEEQDIMKPLSKQEELKLPINKCHITLKHGKLLGIKEYALKEDDTKIYGYSFDDISILMYHGTIFKQEDKPSFKFNLISKEEVRSNNSWYHTHSSYPYAPNGRGKVKTNLPSEYQVELKLIKEKEKVIKDICLVKVINYNKSSDIFGYRPSKKEMLSKYFQIKEIDYNYYHESTKSNLSIVILSNPSNGKSLKFLMEDLEFIVPNPDLWLKSYNKPKDRQVKVGSAVRVINDKYGNVTKEEKLRVKLIDDKNYFLTVGSYLRPGIRRNFSEVSIRRGRDEDVGYIGSINIVHSIQNILNNSIGDLTAPMMFGEPEPDFRYSEPYPPSYKNKSTNKVKINSNCNVWCVNDKGKEVKVKLKQIKVI